VVEERAEIRSSVSLEEGVMGATRVMAMFGVDVASEGARVEALRARCARVAREIDEALCAGGVGLVTGASGSGKSTALGAFVELVRARGEGAVVCGPDGGGCAAPIVERVGRSAAEGMRVLAAAGLGEARLLGRREGELSAGQRARFQLAVGMDGARRVGARSGAPVTLVVDEFGSGLDELTARSLAHSFGKWARAAGVRALVAGSRADVAGLAPDVVVCMDGGSVETRERRGERTALAINVEAGVMADYLALSHYHYAAERPGPVCLVLRALDDASGVLAGVLVVSRPTLNARWRRLAWPDRYEDRDLRARALLLNAEVRVISRLIVDPRFRACGVGTRLARVYLADPLTERTEAMSAMGAVCPVFERAGMTPVRMAQRPQDGRLARFLAARAVAPEALVDAPRVEALWEDVEAQRELRIWANASRRTRRLLEGDVRELCRGAARALLGEPVAYVAGGSREWRMENGEWRSEIRDQRSESGERRARIRDQSGLM
jgi:energy-coupling factor transporter ATP-binding protein EcfA2